MRYYETIYIVNPNLSEEDYAGVLKKFNELVDKHKGVLIKAVEWGKQRMAYEVKKCDKGFYVLLNYCGEPKITAEIERELKLDDKILLYQTVKLADSVDPKEMLLKESKEASGAKKDQDSDREEAEIMKKEESNAEVNNGL
ncbi:MAG: 30S ribosomal protein S6 [Deltaproteobacteria bacterium]|nr:30S ribosomal protein S6 [Deltaproteobacteria bacterium]